MTGELTEAQLREIFERDIRPELDALGASSREEPTLLLVLVGGQPGAGKSKAISRIEAQHPGIVEVIGDDLRNFHPTTTDLCRRPRWPCPPRRRKRRGGGSAWRLSTCVSGDAVP